jgi:phosphatidylglycerophosphate synthase
MGFVIIGLTVFQITNFKTWIVILLTLGLLTDIFDGIIARSLGIATQQIRRLDSSVDQVFFIAAAVAAYLICPVFFNEHAVMLIVLLSFEALTYVVSFLKFKKEIATHSWGAKLWTLILFATLIQLVVQCQSDVLFSICFWLGLLTRLEIIAIILALRTWTNDVPTFYHALALKRGKEIKRYKLF